MLSCTIIVTNATQWMMPFHDRMPVLLAAKDFDAWLNGTLPPSAFELASEDAPREWPVSRRVNQADVGDDDPTIIEKQAA
jgi:putative SOS response-associated peptidase YedK